jgi:TetR/AcrR family transcriptional regulator
MTTSADLPGTEASPEDPVGAPALAGGSGVSTAAMGSRDEGDGTADGAAAAPGDGSAGGAAVAPARPEDESAVDGVDADAAPADRRAAPLTPSRKRPKPGERRVQILHTLAGMLQEPGADRVTTAALAAKLAVSEAALYRHFASKAQMFEGLIDFIEQTVFTLVNQIAEREPDAHAQVQKVLSVVLQFGEKNPGMTRVMVGDALVFEHERLLVRMNQFFDRIESHLRQSLRAAAEAAASATPSVDANAQASVLTAFLVGRLQRYARSGFRRSPTEHLEASMRLLVRAETPPA